MSSRPSPSSHTPLLAASAVVLSAAFLLWDFRVREAEKSAASAASLAHNSTTSTRSENETNFTVSPRALKLLERTWRADNTLIYQARYQTTAIFGEHRMISTARLERAPKRLNITYLGGAREGLQLGFNERWFWRRDGREPMQAYVEVALRPDEMVSRRFRIMRSNYGARLLSPAVLEGRPCDVVEVRRLKKIDGAIGPWKSLWIDRQTGLTLRTDSYNHEGKLIMRSQLSNLKVQSVVAAPDFVQPEQMVKAARINPWLYEEMNADRSRVQKAAGIAPPHITQLPQGFEFDSVGTHRFDSSQTQRASLTRLTDGLNVITVFAFRKVSQKSPHESDSTPRDFAPCDFGLGTMAMRQLPNGIVLLAVGDLSAQTLQKLLSATEVPQ